MDVFNILNKPGGGFQERGIVRDQSQPSQPPNLTEEQKLSMMKFMEELEDQRTSDPAAFQETMKSLGIDGSSRELGDKMNTCRHRLSDIL
jgi:hypothetical protein